ncbi:MAG: DUF1641 domain-containing protein [Firmicutes bacterium]|nr:DUF1641 domain-containing protein [Bacillota bacterium]
MSREDMRRDVSASADGLPAELRLPDEVGQALAENQESLGRALRLLGRMEREGTLEELADLLAIVKMVKGALSDDMGTGAARRLESLGSLAADPILNELASRLPAALRAAEREAANVAPGWGGLLKHLRDPAVRRGLAFFLALARHLAPQPMTNGAAQNESPRSQPSPAT